MVGIEALSDVENYEADGGGGSEPGSAEVCGRETEGLREQINALLASAGTTDKSTITTGEEINGGFMVVKSGGKRVNLAEIAGIGKALGGGFQLAKVRVDGGGKVYMVKPRNVAPSEGVVNGGRTGRREKRRSLRKARQDGLRATNPHLNPVES